MDVSSYPVAPKTPQQITTNYICNSTLSADYDALPHTVGAQCIDGRCLSVYPIPDPKSRMEGLSELKIDRTEARDTGDP